MYRRFLALLVCLMLQGSALAQSTADEKLAAAFERYSTLGACVAVIQNGEVTYTCCYGEDRIGGNAVTEDTVFQVGSISKMVSSIGLMLLLEDAGLALDAELGEALGYSVRHPDFPQQPITLRQLMTHTAALRDSGDYQQALSGDPLTLSALFSQRAEYTFQRWKPGTRRAYSNLGGGLIGSLIEALSGQTVDAYMAGHVFAPLEITAAYQPALIPQDRPLADLFHMPQRQLAKRLREDTSLVHTPDPETHYWLTAGKLMISAPDLAKILIALCDGGVWRDVRLLKESTVAQILTRQDYVGSVACETGNGLFLNIITDHQVQGRTMYGHGGKANGMLCAAYFDPSDRTGVVMLTNGCRNDSVHNGVGMLGRVVMRICYDEIIGDAHVKADPFAVE